MWIALAVLAAAGAQGVPDRADLRNMFLAMDRNGDGFITQNEAPRLTRVRVDSPQRATIRQVGSWIDRYDADGDTRVSRNEFLHGAEAEMAAYRSGG